MDLGLCVVEPTASRPATPRGSSGVRPTCPLQLHPHPLPTPLTQPPTHPINTTQHTKLTDHLPTAGTKTRSQSKTRAKYAAVSFVLYIHTYKGDNRPLIPLYPLYPHPTPYTIHSTPYACANYVPSIKVRPYPLPSYPPPTSRAAEGVLYPVIPVVVRDRCAFERSLVLGGAVPAFDFCAVGALRAACVGALYCGARWLLSVLRCAMSGASAALIDARIAVYSPQMLARHVNLYPPHRSSHATFSFSVHSQQSRCFYRNSTLDGVRGGNALLNSLLRVPETFDSSNIAWASSNGRISRSRSAYILRQKKRGCNALVR